MRILAVGDVMGKGAVAHLEEKLWGFRKAEKIDFCIVNCENAGFITGADPESAERLFMAGADCLSGGNHTLKNKAIYTYLDDKEAILRPVNFPDDAPGHGYCILDCMGYRVLVICVMGCVYIEPVLDSPYGFIDRILEKEMGEYDIAVLDIHAEATGEKLALAREYDGRINVIFGTHTHVQTADEQVLPGGSGYITDLGMCAPTGGVLGLDSRGVIKRMRTKLPEKMIPAEGPCVACGAIFDLDAATGRVSSVRRVRIE